MVNNGPIYLDTETTSLYGMPIIVQYVQGDAEDVQIHNFWTNPISDSLKLIESFYSNEDGLVFFNAAFDQFMLSKIYTTFYLYPDKDAIPEDIVDQLGEYEYDARDGPCLKPVKVCDVMLHARKTSYQSLMKRRPIRIKRIPTVLAYKLANKLETLIPLKDIFFSKRKNKTAPKWQVVDLKNTTDFKDIVLKFSASASLKALASDALQIKQDEILLFRNIEISKKFYSKEPGQAPFAKAIGNRFNWYGAWPEVIKYHINHWEYNQLARKYAADDVKYTRGLYKYFGSPEMNDNDSVLACMVGAVRWKGYTLDIDKIKQLREEKLKQVKLAPKAPAYVKRFLDPYLSDEDKLVLKGSTKKTILEELASRIDENGVKPEIAIKAQLVLNARFAAYEVNFYDKLLQAGRLHASLDVIGAKSSRMSGADNLNVQGIKKDKRVRACFTLAPRNMILCGGDFSAFEVVIYIAISGDEELLKDIQAGKKIHGIFGSFVYPHMTYEEIVASDGLPGEQDKYTRSKSAVFAKIYGGNYVTFHNKLGVNIEDAKQAELEFERRYPGVGKQRLKIESRFCTMRQSGGIGSAIEWHKPDDYIETIFGFKRYFTLENQLAHALFNLANKVPREWKELKVKVQRRDREQFVSGAVQSALFAAAFNIQSQNNRAAQNHIIQSAGGSITKHVQRRVWDLQPAGIHPFVVMPLNIHDEVLAPCLPEYKDKIAKTVQDTINELKNKVPLLKMDWKTGAKNWADVKG